MGTPWTRYYPQNQNEPVGNHGNGRRSRSKGNAKIHRNSVPDHAEKRKNIAVNYTNGW